MSYKPAGRLQKIHRQFLKFDGIDGIDGAKFIYGCHMCQFFPRQEDARIWKLGQNGKNM